MRAIELAGSPLWYDEIFSFCVATGHAMCVPAEHLKPELGDYVAPTDWQPATYYRRYTQFDDNLSVYRLLRGIWMSDWHPPLHIFLLSFWLRLFGSNDITVRLFSLPWSLGAAYFVWLLARRLGGRKAGLFAAALFMINPTIVFYSVEARDYSVILFFSALLPWLVVRAHDKGCTRWQFAWLVLATAGAFYTHYFMAFFVAGCYLWLLRFPGKARRLHVIAAGALAGLLALPWYLNLLYIFKMRGQQEGCRWFIGPMPWLLRITEPSRFIFWQGNNTREDAIFWELASIFFIAPLWGIACKRYLPIASDRLRWLAGWAMYPLLALSWFFCFMVAQALARVPKALFWVTPVIALQIWLASYLIVIITRNIPGSGPGRRMLLTLIWVCLLSPLFGPALADALWHGYLATIPRYFVDVLPAWAVLMGLAIAAMKPRRRLFLLSGLTAIYIGCVVVQSTIEERESDNFPALARFIQKQDPRYPVIVHEVSTTAVCISRKLPDDRLMYCWSDDLKSHPGEEVVRLINGKPGVIFVHGRCRDWVGKEDKDFPLLVWLKKNARLQEKYDGRSRSYVFVPKDGQTFQFAAETK
jgi:4-amino-4-deoxy-L-arabinose transferase-like glycosyltransferase